MYNDDIPFFNNINRSSGNGNGKDGVSPTVAIVDIENGHKITITDINGSKSFDVINGINGIDGEKGDKGDPYTLTEADKLEIANTVLSLIPDGDEVSY